MKRYLIPALLAVVVIAGGAAYFYSQQTASVSELAAARSSGPAGSAATQNAGTGEKAISNAAELLAPGPLDDRSIGNADAPVTIIEYASLTCPHCAAFHAETLPALKAKYIDTGKVRLIFREFPLDNYAAAGFMLARCAEGDKYFPIVDAFFKQQGGLMAASDPYAWVEGFAKQVGFTKESMESCLTNQQLLDNVQAVRQRATEKFGVTSTPTFFINGVLRRGDLKLDEIEKDILPLLRS